MAEVQAIEVTRKKAGALGGLGKITLMLMGGMAVVTGAIFCLTVVGILIGFPMMLGGFGFIALAMGKQVVKCPDCKKRNTVFQRVEDFKCQRCETPVEIKWK